jgi:hypothetical protein
MDAETHARSKMNALPVASPLSAVERRQWLVVYSKARPEVSAQFHVRHRVIRVCAPQVLLPECRGAADAARPSLSELPVRRPC